MLGNFLLCSLVLFVIVTVRYFVFAGAAWYWTKCPLRKRRIDPSPLKSRQVSAEISYSLATSAIFAVSGAILFFSWQSGHAKLYWDRAQFGLWYLPFSFCLLLFLHETYFYWTHRWMHEPRVFRFLHKIHHDSINPTPWAAFSFHPYEAVLEAAILPVLVLLIPVHVGVFLLFLTVMTVLGVINHLGHEIYPVGFHRNPVGKFLITPTHHSLHHRRVTGNYGLYFTFWDRWMGTEHADYAV